MTKAIVLPDFINTASWHHAIELPDGQIVGAGHGKPLTMMRRQFDMTFAPLDLTGKSVLDIGTWNGAFAVEAVRRGASRVVALDHVVWHPPFRHGRETFNFVVEAFGYSSIIKGVDVDLDASPLSLSGLGTFDIVLFLGVFYHLIDPIGALKEISKITKECIVVETYCEPSLPPQPPAMIFYPGSELANDPTNWWGANASCIDGILRTVGFTRIDEADISFGNRKFFHAYKA